MFGVLGLVVGPTSAAVRRLAGGRRTFPQLPRARFVASGALGALVAAAALRGAGLSTLGLVVAAAVLGASSAAGTLAVARAA